MRNRLVRTLAPIALVTLSAVFAAVLGVLFMGLVGEVVSSALSAITSAIGG